MIDILPYTATAFRLVGMLPTEQHDERQAGKRYFRAESLATLVQIPTAPPAALGA